MFTWSTDEQKYSNNIRMKRAKHECYDDKPEIIDALKDNIREVISTFKEKKQLKIKNSIDPWRLYQ